MALFAALLLLHLGGSAVLGAKLNLDLGRDWKLITDDYTEIDFPLDSWILEIKTLDNIRDSSFVFNLTEEEMVDIEDNQMDGMTMHTFAHGMPVANFFWSRKGNEEANGAFDVRIRYCTGDNANYKSDVVCEGRDVQVWAWDLERGTSVSLFCYGNVEYVYDITEQSWCPWTNDVIDSIKLLHMKGYYLRAIAKGEVLVPTTATTEDPFVFPTTEEPDVPDPPPGVHTTCDCWTRECTWCEDPKCRVGYDVTGAASRGITVISSISYQTVNTVFLFGSDGQKLGTFQFNKRGIFLEGCINCAAPTPFPKYNIAETKQYDWNVRFTDGSIVLTIHGTEIFRQELIGECAEMYSDIQEFAFSDIGCDGSFLIHEGSEIGRHFTDTDTCGTECPAV